jgi:glycosyltransferase involved in cell wall biosynthesis
MITPGSNGQLVPPGDIEAIARAMQEVLRAPQQYQRATSTGLERYTRAAYLANYRSFVEALAHQARKT